MPETLTTRKHDGVLLLLALALVLMGAVYIYHEDNGCSSELAGQEHYDRDSGEWRPFPECD